jgi:hypothetical protein
MVAVAEFFSLCCQDFGIWFISVAPGALWDKGAQNSSPQTYPFGLLPAVCNLIGKYRHPLSRADTACERRKNRCIPLPFCPKRVGYASQCSRTRLSPPGPIAEIISTCTPKASYQNTAKARIQLKLRRRRHTQTPRRIPLGSQVGSWGQMIPLGAAM